MSFAKQHNLQLQQQKESKKMAQLEERVQKAQRLPTLDFSLFSSYLSEINEIDLSKTIGIMDRRVALGGHDRSELMLSIRQPVFTGFRLQSQVALAKNDYLSEQTKFDILSNEIYHQVYLIFYKFQSLTNQRRILEESLKRLNIQLDQVRNLFNAAQVMAFDTLRVYNQTLTIKIELQNIQLASRLATLQMARILDLKQVQPISEIQLKRPMVETMDLKQYKSEALAKRPELHTMRLAKNETHIRQRLFRANYFPVVLAQANFHYAKPGLDPVANEWMDYFSVGLNVQWNLWRWQGDKKKVEEFQVLQNRLTLAEKELLQTIDYEVEESFENLKFSLQQWRLSEELRDQQAERYRIVSVQHQNNIASTNELITAEADLTKAELQTQQALIRYYMNLADLKKATGSIGENID
ncbi:MAG: TolC family protein [bacterium]